MARRKESDRNQQNNDDSDSNPNDEVDEEPNFDDPEGYEDDISEEGTVFSLLNYHMASPACRHSILQLSLQILWEIL